MHLIVGGKGQGKLHYALSLGYTEADGAPGAAHGQAHLYGLQDLTREDPTLTAADIPDCIVICDELGCGVVPMDYEDRAWRERTGRLLCDLAAKADRVDPRPLRNPATAQVG